MSELFSRSSSYVGTSGVRKLAREIRNNTSLTTTQPIPLVTASVSNNADVREPTFPIAYIVK